MLRIRTIVVALVPALAFGTSCERETVSPSSSGSSSAPAADEKAAGGGVTSSAPSSTAEKPRAKASEKTADDRVGVLPDGIGIPVGRPAPDVSLTSSEGKSVELRELYRDKAVLVVFYRGGWCPFCNFQIRELTQAYPEIAKRGVTPVAVSVDQATESAKTAAAYDIPFPVLSDPDLAAHKAFRVTHEASADEVARLKSFGMDLEASSGRTHHTIAIPSLFLVDREGKVRWAHADPDYKVRPTTAQILTAIDEAGIGGGASTP